MVLRLGSALGGHITTVDRTKQVRQSQLRLSGFFVQHMIEYSNSDSAGVQRAVDYMNSVYDNGWVATHGSSPGFRQVDAMPTEGQYVWATSGNMRGLFDPATGNQAVVPAMARVNKAKRMLVTFGVPKPYSSNAGASDYDFYPCRADSYTKLGQFWVKIAQEAKNRGLPFHGASHRQELKKQTNRNFGAGGGGQSEVDSYTAIYEALKSWDPTFPMFGPHLATGGTRSLTDRQRPMKWAYDHDFFIGWMQRVPGWDGVFIDWANTDYNAQGAAEGVGNPDLQATWVPNWRLQLDDAYGLMAPYVGPTKPARIGFIEHYSLEVWLQHWSLYTPEQKAAFQFATLCELTLGGCNEVFDWQPEGSYENGAFADYFGLFNKTAIGSSSTETGKPNAKGLAVKAFHDLVPPGTPVFDVATGNTRVFGIATPTQTAVVNLNSSAWNDTVEGQAVSLKPYSYAIVKAAAPPPPPPVDPTIKRADLDAARNDLNTIIASAQDALKHLPS